MTKFSSFKKQQKLFENWRRFTETGKSSLIKEINLDDYGTETSRFRGVRPDAADIEGGTLIGPRGEKFWTIWASSSKFSGEAAYDYSKTYGASDEEATTWAKENALSTAIEEFDKLPGEKDLTPQEKIEARLSIGLPKETPERVELARDASIPTPGKME